VRHEVLADAHISREMIAMLRDLGHDCRDSSEIPPRTTDVDVLHLAAAEARVIITADKDFGELVFVHQIACPGALLIRLALPNETDRVAHMRSLLPLAMAPLARLLHHHHRGGPANTSNAVIWGILNIIYSRYVYPSSPFS
jgi:predicted nuclease of predicted toxin-antitoxin system